MKIEQVLAGTSENHIAPFLWVHGEDYERYRARGSASRI